MPGAGKSTIANGLESKGYEIINMGNEVRAEAKRRNLEPTGQNLGKLMLELREKKRTKCRRTINTTINHRIQI